MTFARNEHCGGARLHAFLTEWTAFNHLRSAAILAASASVTLATAPDRMRCAIWASTHGRPSRMSAMLAQMGPSEVSCQ
jgi:hypothetical protein